MAAKKTARKRASGRKSAAPRSPQAPISVLPARGGGGPALRLKRPAASKPLRPIQVRPSKSRLMMPAEDD